MPMLNVPWSVSSRSCRAWREVNGAVPAVLAMSITEAHLFRFQPDSTPKSLDAPADIYVLIQAMARPGPWRDRCNSC